MAKAGNCYYEQLNKEQQKELSDIYFMIRMDSPAIFYSVTFSYRFYPDSTMVEMVLQYLFTKDKIKEHRQAMESRVKKLVRQAVLRVRFEEGLNILLWNKGGLSDTKRV